MEEGRGGQPLLKLGLCLLALWTSGGLLPGVSSESDPAATDFEFADPAVRPVGTPNLEATLLDDEDYRHALGGSGDESEGGSGEEAPTPGYPTTPSGEDPEYFRSTVNFTSLVFTAALRDRNSQEFQKQARQMSNALENLFSDIPGTQVVTVLQFRPGSTDPNVKPSMIITFDLGTVSFYNRVVLFNTINNALNRGRITDYLVTTIGFSFRPLSARVCPLTIGRTPSKLSSNYNNWANLMVSNRFICDGNIYAFTYYRGLAEGLAYVGIWRQANFSHYLLKQKFALHPQAVGIHTIRFDPPIAITRGDFLGIHYPSAASSGVISGSQSGNNDVAENEYYHTYNVMLFDEEIEAQRRLIDVSRYNGGPLRRTFAFVANLTADIAPNTTTTTSPTEGRVTSRPGKLRTCSATEFTCIDGQCIELFQKCDGLPNCRDSSDEVACGRKCTTTEFQCETGHCINGSRRCDRHYDCSDSSDELNCGTCGLLEFTCNNKRCVDLIKKCDGYDNCEDGSDELDCAPLTCSSQEFTCDNSRCIDVRRKCDQHDDCGDASDENSCVVTCGFHEFKCDNDVCIDARRKCDGRDDCGDRSDESNCVVEQRCREDEFRCEDGQCIAEHQRCNRQYDCTDTSDEQNCPTPTCPTGQFTCKTGECIYQSSVCDRRSDCEDDSDEENCDPVTCGAHQFTCLDRQCIEVSRRCDGEYDCQDYSDERDCSPPTTTPMPECLGGQFRCGSGDCIDAVKKCDRRRDCPDSSDERNCPPPTTTPMPECLGGQFRCGSGDCIDAVKKCDRRRDCPDSSDELNCPVTQPCQRHEFSCENGECIDFRRKCDGRPDCTDQSDEYNCLPSCSSGQFKCRSSGRCIDMRRQCDQRRDCSDGSDEHLCTTTPITVQVSPAELTVREGQEAVFQCRAIGRPPPVVRWSRGTQGLPAGASDVNGRLTIQQATREHNGEYTCSALSQQGNIQDTATLHVQPFGPTRTPPEPGVCSRDQATCQNGQCISRDYICDADFDCSDRSDEANCINPLPCEPNEFQCNNGKCAQKIWRCDGDDDCGDMSDETNCPTSDPNAKCRQDEYECLAGDQCIPASYQCDGEIDCQDRSDEIGCAAPTVIRPPTDMAMAARGETITIECEAIGVPTPLIVWRLNWGHIGKPPRVTTWCEAGHGTLTIRQARSEDEGAYTCEAINSKGSIFAQPDTILTVKEPAGLCQSPMFNAEAASITECLRCFCFGIRDQCVSSTLFKSKLGLSGEVKLVEKRTREPIVGNFVQANPSRREYVVDDYTRRVRGDYYWSMPAQLLGNRLTSYGTTLDYSIFYEGFSDFTAGADVIIHGNGITLYHTHFTRPFSGLTETVSVLLQETDWSKEQYNGRGDVDDLVRASRSDLMMVLQNVEYILIRSGYDSSQTEVRISEVSLGTGVVQETGHGRAALVEECACPTGYEGHSCEKCAGGFRRMQAGRYLGQCVACQCNGHSNDCDQHTGLCTNCNHNTEGERCEQCSRGFYGSALGGTAADCLACPCPLTDSRNQFSPECRLGSTGQVQCTACPEGYEGNRCERCSAGYQGNPMSPGDRCRPEGQVCDIRGSQSDNPDAHGQCSCKQNTQGPTCDSCRQATFHLSEVNTHGCIKCFCMGVTQHCASSGYYKAQIGGPFVSNTQNFALSDNQRLKQITEGVRLNPAERELIFREFSRLDERDKAYYWNMPSKFLGAKVTSYGGSLRYTIQYSPGFDTSPNDFPDVYINGNDIDLVYHHSQVMMSDKRMAVTIPFTEEYWRRLDSTPATREHLMMALANLDYILIKATYTGSTSEASIRDVSMDYADSRRTEKERALSVEQCSCPAGYKGTSCEECDVGYRRTGGGLYLGLCERCTCNRHSEDCDSTTGRCSNCAHNTDGNQCERCATGFYGDATRGGPNDCQRCPCPLADQRNQFSSTCVLDRDNLVTCTACPVGYEGRNCERCAPGYEGDPRRPGDSCRQTDVGGGGDEGECRCHAPGTVAGTMCNRGQCQCKSNVEGPQCDRCRPGYFNIDAETEDGCQSCFCSGQSRQCSKAAYYIDQISPMYDNENHNFVLTDRRLGQAISDGMTANPIDRSITFNQFSPGSEASSSQRLFFHLPPRFRGNQILSYGGHLKFGLQFHIAYDAGQTFNDVDIEILSGNDRFYYLFNPQAKPGILNKYDILLTEDTFRNLNPTQTSRETFMKALSNIDAILIRATYHTIMAKTTLKGLTMDTAVPHNTEQTLASSIEYCQCPSGYGGTSCEQCAAGFNPVPDHTTGNLQCVSCRCHGHGSGCDPVRGTCTGCQHNTAGDQCERCVQGFYGDATVGTANDCRQCSCPLTLPSNSFSPTCFLDTDGRGSCDACQQGYTGRDCGQCAEGYRGNPRQAGGHCEPLGGGDRSRPAITLHPTSVTERAGATVTIRVRIISPSTYTAQWSRADGQALPSRASIAEDYSLTIHSLIPADTGRYIVVANNEYGQTRDEVEITVQGSKEITVVIQEPKERTMQAGTTVRFVCMGISQVSQDGTYILAWQFNGGSMVRRMEDFGDGTLTIRDVRPSDQGTYTCTGSNPYDEDTAIATLYVEVSEEQPTVRLDPRYLQLQVGDPVEFKCTATGTPTPLLEWAGGPGGRLSPHSTFIGGVFRIPAVTKDDEAEYFCTAKNTAGSAQVRTIIYVSGDGPIPTPTPRPTARPGNEVEVDVGQPQYQAEYGRDARLQCGQKGTGHVVNILWSRHGGALPAGSRQDNGLLMIPRCTEEYSGRYLCTITVATGHSATGYVDFTVSRRGGGGGGDGGSQTEPPTATVEPQQQTISQGQSGTIRCVVTGTPTPSVKWSKVRGELSARHKVVGTMLRITSAIVDDRGVYLCEVENSAGRTRGHAIVEVERRELPEIEMYPQAGQSVTTGGSALFQCRVTRGIPTPDVKWMRAGNQPLSSTTEVLENGVIRFNRVDGSEQGSYICTASNEVGTITATATLTIGGRPRVTFSVQSPHRVRRGSRVYVECIGEGAPTPVVYWRFPQRAGSPTGRLEDHTTTGSAVLDIHSVTMDQAGMYYCVSRNDAGETEERFELTVTGHGGGPGGQETRPTFENSRRELDVKAGEVVELTCTVGGTPPPTIRWSRRPGVIPSNHDLTAGRLRLQAIRVEDAGDYICTASNRLGSADAVFTIRVQGAPEVFVNPPSQTVRAGERAHLQCQTRGSQAITTQWSKVGGALSSAARERDGTLEIGPITAADAGTYRCVAVTGWGRAEAYAEVVVSAPPSAIVAPQTMTQTIGETVQLRCKGTGSPRPKIQWGKESGPLPEQHTIQDGVLTIYRLQREDAGRYVCMVTNREGTAQAYAHLIVQSPVGPIRPEEPIRQNVDIGDNVELSCDAAGSIRGTFNWERVGDRLPASGVVRGATLYITRVKENDGGAYQCTVTDINGQQSSTIVEITVQGPPGFRVESQTRRATVGGQVTLSCTPYGTPTPAIHWSKRGGDLPRERQVTEGELHIRRVTPEDFGDYVCQAANRFGRREANIRLEQGELVPRFLQDPSSYIALDTLPEAYYAFDVEISFFPETSDGLLIYNGQMAGEGDFMSLGLREGRVEFRFDVGSGPVIIHSEPVQLDKWHTSRIKRSGKDGTLIVDGREYTGRVLGSFEGLDLVEYMYIGGVPDYNAIARHASFRSGFLGGVSRLLISGEEISLGGAALEMKGVTDYPSCSSPQGSPLCGNGGTCRAASTAEGFRCTCQTGYSGSRCELVGEKCYEDVCGVNGRCYDLPSGVGYRCVCPVGRTGNRCEKGALITMPMFNRTSFIAYPPIQNAQTMLHVSMRVNPTSFADSIILYNAQDDHGNGDFVSVTLINGNVEFRFDSGSGPAIITSTTPLRLGEWANIVVERSEKDGSLTVNNEIAIKGSAPDAGVSAGSTVGLNLKGNLFIGGVDHNIRVAPGVGVDTGFTGCILELIVKSAKVELVNDALESANIRDCGAPSKCARDPCQNGGQCIEIPGGRYVCECKPGFEGTNCEIQENECTRLQPCRNNGRCNPVDDTYVCECHVGFTGRDCHIAVPAIDDFETLLPSSGDGSMATVNEHAMFNRNGYMQLPADLLADADQPVFEVKVTTDQSNGLIMWQGQQPGEHGRGQDYVLLAVQNGHALFSFELGSGAANITSPIRIDDGQPHHLRATRTGREGTLEVDNIYRTDGSSQGSTQMLNVKGDIYIGGLPDAPLMTDGLYNEGIIGCIQDIYMGETGPIDFSIDSTGGKNVLPCPSS